MAKTVPLSKFQEWRGLDRISPVVHEMHCIFREITKDDFGIDGEIEVVVQKPGGEGYQTTGGIIKVQAKSGMSYVKQDTKTSFASPVTKSDLDLWYNSNFPTIYIVFHPEDDLLYWKEVRSYVKNAPNVWQAPFKIVFNKATDAFTPECYEQLSALAYVSPSRVSYTIKERLFSNLLRIKRLPWVWSSPSDERDYEGVRRQISGFKPPFALRSTRLYTLSNLDDEMCILRDFCDTSDIRIERREDWWHDHDFTRLYVFLLNQLLGIHMRRLGISYNSHFSRNYFPRKDEESLESKRGWYNIRTRRNVPGRTVVKFYEYGRDQFWRHKAADLGFERIGRAWYLRIVPKYLYTMDGHTPHDSSKVGPWTTTIKANERNMNVLNDVLFWSDVLSGDNASDASNEEIHIHLDFNVVMIIEKLPMFGVAAFSIPSDPAAYEEPDLSEQLTLFDLARQEGDHDDDY